MMDCKISSHFAFLPTVAYVICTKHIPRTALPFPSSPSSTGLPYKCDKCDKAFKSALNLGTHKRTCGMRRTKCQFCKLEFPSYESVRQHERRAHMELYQKEQAKRLPQSDAETFSILARIEARAVPGKPFLDQKALYKKYLDARREVKKDSRKIFTRVGTSTSTSELHSPSTPLSNISSDPSPAPAVASNTQVEENVAPPVVATIAGKPQDHIVPLQDHIVPLQDHIAIVPPPTPNSVSPHGAYCSPPPPAEKKKCPPTLRALRYKWREHLRKTYDPQETPITSSISRHDLSAVLESPSQGSLPSQGPEVRFEEVEVLVHHDALIETDTTRSETLLTMTHPKETTQFETPLITTNPNKTLPISNTRLDLSTKRDPCNYSHRSDPLDSRNHLAGGCRLVNRDD